MINVVIYRWWSSCSFYLVFEAVFGLPLPVSIKSKGVPRQTEVAQGVPGRLRPRIILTFRHYKGGRSSAKRTGRLYPRRNPWYSLSEAESTLGHMVLSAVPRKKTPVTPLGINLYQFMGQNGPILWPLQLHDFIPAAGVSGIVLRL